MIGTFIKTDYLGRDAPATCHTRIVKAVQRGQVSPSSFMAISVVKKIVPFMLA
jgi:hypothetical protein